MHYLYYMSETRLNVWHTLFHLFLTITLWNTTVNPILQVRKLRQRESIERSSDMLMATLLGNGRAKIKAHVRFKSPSFKAYEYCLPGTGHEFHTTTKICKNSRGYQGRELVMMLKVSEKSSYLCWIFTDKNLINFEKSKLCCRQKD